jgi:hypothetical protein
MDTAAARGTLEVEEQGGGAFAVRGMQYLGAQPLVFLQCITSIEIPITIDLNTYNSTTPTQPFSSWKLLSSEELGALSAWTLPRANEGPTRPRLRPCLVFLGSGVRNKRRTNACIFLEIALGIESTLCLSCFTMSRNWT